MKIRTIKEWRFFYGIAPEEIKAIQVDAIMSSAGRVCPECGVGNKSNCHLIEGKIIWAHENGPCYATNILNQLNEI